MSLITYEDFELKIFRVVKKEETWEGDGLIARECFEIRDGDSVLMESDLLEDLFRAY